MTSIYDAITADHDEHRKLLSVIADTSGDSDARKEAWTAFYYDVKSHAAAEEETFYAKLMAQPWGQDAARHSVHEHQQLDDLMEALNEMDMGEGAWLTKFKALKHDYEHHMDEEEADVFGRARQVVDASAVDEIGARFLKRKDAERKIVDEKTEDSLED